MIGEDFILEFFNQFGPFALALLSLQKQSSNRFHRTLCFCQWPTMNETV